YVFNKISLVLDKEFIFDKKEIARKKFYELRHLFIDWNYKEFQSQDFKKQEKTIDNFFQNYKEMEEKQ
ncbi:MAG: V-type ATP synthase subunit A, partial [Candidatus Susulua stagnicola]|nr:V-type ATP synthase subunit A [Candidatus Susulua stagnicola]